MADHRYIPAVHSALASPDMVDKDWASDVLSDIFFSFENGVCATVAGAKREDEDSGQVVKRLLEADQQELLDLRWTDLGPLDRAGL